MWVLLHLKGGIVDGPFNGAAPSPWSITMQPDAMFKSQQKYSEVSCYNKLLLHVASSTCYEAWDNFTCTLLPNI